MMLMVPVGAMVTVVALRMGMPLLSQIEPVVVGEDAPLRGQLRAGAVGFLLQDGGDLLRHLQPLLGIVGDAHHRAGRRRGPSPPGRSCGCPG